MRKLMTIILSIVAGVTVTHAQTQQRPQFQNNGNQQNGAVFQNQSANSGVVRKSLNSYYNPRYYSGYKGGKVFQRSSGFRNYSYGRSRSSFGFRGRSSYSSRGSFGFRGRSSYGSRYSGRSSFGGGRGYYRR